MSDVLELDALVVGAGPAGSATARRLALRGVRTALLERSAFDEARIGESLPPRIKPLLRELGVWQDFCAIPQLPSFGVQSAWGSAEPETRSYLTSPHGCGFHVDRRRFDRMLAEAARAAGAALLERVALQRCRFVDGRFELRARRGTDALCLTAPVVIDATGRRAQLARGFGAQRLMFDRAIAVAEHWAELAGERGGLLVETTRDGFWYSAPLPDAPERPRHTTIAIWLTDADLYTPALVEAALERAPITRARLAKGQKASEVRVHCAHSQRLRHPERIGPVLAVGDAALAVDPVSGSGVVRALQTAREAADAVCDVLERPYAWREIIEAYEAARDAECTRYLAERASYYALERRFDSAYWSRRALRDRLTA